MVDTYINESFNSWKGYFKIGPIFKGFPKMVEIQHVNEDSSM